MKAPNPKPPAARNHFRRVTSVLVNAASAFGVAAMGFLSHSSDQLGEPKHAINKYDLLRLVSKSFKEERIDLYQAALLLETNCNRAPVNGVDHPLKIITLHNLSEDRLDFSHKTGELIRGLLKEDYTYDELLRSGILQKPKKQLETDTTGIPHFTMEDIESDNGIKLAERHALHSNGEGKDELVAKNFGFTQDAYQKTYSAIPRKDFMEQVTRSMRSGRMNYMQAMMMFSVNSHSLETRKRGNRRYLDHPMAVADDPALTKDQRFIALVHDVIENSNYTLDDFRQALIPDYMIHALDGVTIRADERDDYEDFSADRLYDLIVQDPYKIKNYYSFIERCSLNPHSRAVKKADIRHNLLDGPKPHKIPEYKLALAYLDAVDSGEIKPGSSLREWAQNNSDPDIRNYYEGAIQRRVDKIHKALRKYEEANSQEIADRPKQGGPVQDLLLAPFRINMAGLIPATNPPSPAGQDEPPAPAPGKNS